MKIEEWKRKSLQSFFMRAKDRQKEKVKQVADLEKGNQIKGEKIESENIKGAMTGKKEEKVKKEEKGSEKKLFDFLDQKTKIKQQ